MEAGNQIVQVEGDAVRLVRFGGLIDGTRPGGHDLDQVGALRVRHVERHVGARAELVVRVALGGERAQQLVLVVPRRQRVKLNVKSCVEIKFRTPHAIDAMSSPQLHHTGQEAPVLW
mgnify:CR=1 FL=1